MGSEEGVPQNADYLLRKITIYFVSFIEENKKMMDEQWSDYKHFISKLYPTYATHNRLVRVANAHGIETIHAALGLAGETGEIVDLIKKHFMYGKDLDKQELIEEMGDLFHYFARLMHLNGVTLSEVMESNTSKLKKRFPSGYTNEDAINKTEEK